MRRLISLSTTERDAKRDVLDWLRVEFGIERPGQKLETFAGLDADAFIEEVRKRRPKGAARSEAARLERRLSELVNRAYGLTAEEVDLLWNTAPPRMPRF